MNCELCKKNKAECLITRIMQPSYAHAVCRICLDDVELMRGMMFIREMTDKEKEK